MLTRNTLLITECLELAVGPGIEDPALGVRYGLASSFFGSVPVGLDALNQTFDGLVGTCLGILASGDKESAKLRGAPFAVGLDNVVVPIFLDEGLNVFSVRRLGVRDAVVREPPLELSLMPFVVY